VCHAASDEVLVTGGYDQAVKVWDCRSRSVDAIQTMRNFKVSL
jgi:mitogen-activated protein kinase organizer 1